MTRHVLKLWTDQFNAMKHGDKLADVRRCDDRNFFRGDEVLYRDYTAGGDKYSGRALLVRIKHLTRSAGKLLLFGRENLDDRPIVYPLVVLSVELLEAGTYARLSGTSALGEGIASAVVPAGAEVCTRCGELGHRPSDPKKEPAGNNCRAAAAIKKGGRRG